MKPDTASRLLYQEAALRSFLRTDNIAQSFIQNTPNYNMEDLQQLYFASASIKSKKMLIEFVKISTKQLCMSLRDKLPMFRYLNPDNISTDLTDDELMLLIHEASHSMSLDQQIGGHGNIAFLVAKNIIFNLVGVNATATLNSFLKTPDLGSFSSRNKRSETSSFGTTDQFSTSSPPFPMPPPTTSQFPMQQTATSLPLTPASTPPLSPYMTSFGSSPTIISTSVANLSFMSMNSSVPQNSSSFMTIATSTPHTTTHSVTQSSPALAIAETPYRPQVNVEPDFDTRSNASESSNTRFEVIGNSEGSANDDDDDDNSRDLFNQSPTAEYPVNRIDANYGTYDGDSMSIESAHDDNEAEKTDEDEKPTDDEAEKLDNNHDDKDSITNNNRMINFGTTYDDLYEQDQRSFEQEMLQDDEIKRVFEVSKFDDKLKNVSDSEDVNSLHFNTPSSTPPPPSSPVAESPRKLPLRKRPRKRKASRYVEDKEEVNKNEVVQNRPWLEPEVDFKPRNESLSMLNNSIDDNDGSMITNINEFMKRSQPEEKKLFSDDNMCDIMDDLKRKGMINIPSHPRNISFSNIDT